MQVDSGLSFLDDYVTKALQNGASPYKPESERTTEQHEADKGIFLLLRLTSYRVRATPRKL